MPLYQIQNYKPQIHESSFVAPSADVIGRVWLGEESSIWFNCVVRGDINDIKIGDRSNIQDLSVLHVVSKQSLIIGNEVTVGHKVTLHACTIEDNCLIGMDAVILDGAVIGKNSLVAAGSVVPPGKVYPPGSFIIGSPAIAKRELRPEEIEQYGQHYKTYVATTKEYKNQFTKL